MVLGVPGRCCTLLDNTESEKFMRFSKKDWAKYQNDLANSEADFFKTIAGTDSEGKPKKNKDTRSGRYTGRSKYKNQPVYVDNWFFPSKLEANIYNVLKRCRDASENQMWFTRQVPFYLTSSKLVLDYLVCFKGKFTFAAEAKGKESDVWKLKKKEFKLLYPNTELVVWYSVKEAEEFLRDCYRKFIRG